MEETIRNLAAIGIEQEDQNFEDDRNFQRNPKSQVGGSLCEHKEDIQCGENVNWILDPPVDKNNPHGLKPHDRLVCRDVFNVHSSLNVPMTVQNGHKPYEYQKYAKQLCECKECRNNFSLPQCLLMHARTQTEEKLYEYKQCGKTFNSCNYFQTHERIHATKKSDVCKKYGKELQSTAGTERQMITYKGPCKCKLCTKDFSYSTSFLIQGDSHVGEKLYVCKQCGKNFTHPLTLNAMERFMVMRDPMFVSTVRKHLLVLVLCDAMKGFILRETI